MGLETKVKGDILKTKNDWYDFFNLNEEEQKDLIGKLVDEKRLTYSLEKNCYDIFFEYTCGGWGRHQYSNFINGAYFLKKEDAINFRDAVVKMLNKRDESFIKSGSMETKTKKDYPVIHFKIEG